MAKSFFDNVTEYGGFIAIAALVAVNTYQAYEESQEAKQRLNAETWRRESEARMLAMCEHALTNRISKAAFLEMIEAAKNRLLFEAYESTNPYYITEVKVVLKTLDNFAASVA